MIVRAAAKVMVPDGAVNEPPEIRKAELISAPLGKLSEPDEGTSQVVVVAPTHIVPFATNDV